MAKQGETATSYSSDGSEWTLRKISSVAVGQVLPKDAVAFPCMKVLKILLDKPAGDVL